MSSRFCVPTSLLSRLFPTDELRGRDGREDERQDQRERKQHKQMCPGPGPHPTKKVAAQHAVF
jgi:hypothetical protein